MVAAATTSNEAREGVAAPAEKKCVIFAVEKRTGGTLALSSKGGRFISKDCGKCRKPCDPWESRGEVFAYGDGEQSLSSFNDTE